VIDEEKVKAKNKWKNISDVPNLPFESFKNLQNLLENRTCSLGISYPAAREFSMHTNTIIGKLIVLIATLTPFLMVILLIFLSIFLGNYWLLLWTPIPFIANFMGHPMNPSRIVMSFLSFLFLLGGVLFYIFNIQSLFWLCLVFVVSFWANRVMYGINLIALRNYVKTSEALFLYLYEKGALRVTDNETHQNYWAFDIEK
jgi:hypothetical protein